MYALKSVERFIKDNAERIGENRVKEMLERAKNEAHNGTVSGGSIEKIMQDNLLSNEYHNIALRDEEHFEINMSTLHASDKQKLSITQ
ncbi:MAG: hypothetical protein WC788_07390 [Candidatus Paceibacterota bacterium]